MRKLSPIVGLLLVACSATSTSTLPLKTTDISDDLLFSKATPLMTMLQAADSQLVLESKTRITGLGAMLEKPNWEEMERNRVRIDTEICWGGGCKTYYNFLFFDKTGYSRNISIYESNSYNPPKYVVSGTTDYMFPPFDGGFIAGVVPKAARQIYTSLDGTRKSGSFFTGKNIQSTQEKDGVSSVKKCDFVREVKPAECRQAIFGNLRMYSCEEAAKTAGYTAYYRYNMFSDPITKVVRDDICPAQYFREVKPTDKYVLKSFSMTKF